MSILDDIDRQQARQDTLDQRIEQAEEAAEAVLRASDELRRQCEELAAAIKTAADRQDRSWDVLLRQGEEERRLQISERDAVPLLMATIGVLGRKPPSIVLWSGDIVSLDMGDLEQIAAQILEAESGEPRAEGA